MFTYPLLLTYKFFTIGKKISIVDSSGTEVLFVDMKNFRFKEDISVYESSRKERELFQIKADRIIDFSARYRFYENGQELGSVKRKGFKSFWSAHYDLFDAHERHTHIISEENPWIKVVDSLINQIPFGFIVSGFFFHPSYALFEVDQDKHHAVYRLQKKQSWFEGKFSIEQLHNVKGDQEKVMLLSLVLISLLEKARG